jgi:preprotein translocase subunit SecE
MARNRQRAKQRQAERRARRLAEQQAGGQSDPGVTRARSTDGALDEPEVRERPLEDSRGDLAGLEPPRVAPVAPGIDPNLAAGAPPQDEGYSETLIEDEPEVVESEAEALEEIEDWELEEPDTAAAGAGEAGYEVRGRRGREEVHRERPRVIQFLVAVWAELQRVQWPNRQALTTLTGVVLGFVLVAGGYLGLLDAIFSELIKRIL